MSWIKNHLLFIILGFASTMLWQHCITPLDTVPDEAREILVIEGGITDESGPHRIKITRSARYGSRAVGEIEPIKNATVWIRGDNGDQVFLEEEISGNYLTPTSFEGKLGVKYTLLLLLENGERYASLPEEIVTPVNLQEIIPKFKKQPGLDEFSQTVGIELYAKFKDPAGERNFYLWNTKGEFKINTRPDLHAVPDGMGGEIIVPLDCCEFCYFNEGALLTNELNLFTDTYTNGNDHQELVGFIPDDGLRFIDTYMAVVEQYGLTKEAYAFYELLKSQTEIDGDIFDPPPATLRGNVINLDDPEEETIGYFFAASIAKDTVFIERSFLTDPAPIVFIRDDCRILFGNKATTQKPPYWPG